MFIYRGTIILWLLLDVFQFFMMVFLWMSVYEYNQSIQGFTLHEMLLYYLITNLLYVFSDTEAMYIMSEEIREGRISMMLIKPISYKTRLYSEVFGRVIGIFSLTLPIVGITAGVLLWAFKIPFPITGLQVLLAIGFVPLIFMLMFEFSYFFGTISIHTTNVFGLAILMNVVIRIVSGQLIPLALYPTAILRVIDYLPFKYISYPTLVMLGKISTIEALQGLLILAIWVGVFNLFSNLIFKLSMKKIVVFGG
jgi:ABC-2 type transport system permease protein